MADGSLLDNLDEALDNAPRFGLNAKALILKALEEGRAAEGGEGAAKAPGAGRHKARDLCAMSH